MEKFKKLDMSKTTQRGLKLLIELYEEIFNTKLVKKIVNDLENTTSTDVLSSKIVRIESIVATTVKKYSELKLLNFTTQYFYKDGSTKIYTQSDHNNIKINFTEKENELKKILEDTKFYQIIVFSKTTNSNKQIVTLTNDSIDTLLLTTLLFGNKDFFIETKLVKTK